jgi:cysteine desulfurase
VHAGLLGALAGRSRAGRHLVTSAVEHSCVLAVRDEHERAGGDSSVVGVDRDGAVDPERFVAALRDDTAVASLQHANHEVGTVQPVADVAAGCARRGVPLHVDAAQSVGRVAVSLPDLGAQLLSASAHKWGGPAGVGVLIVRKGTRWRGVGPGDERGQGRAPGFENVPAIAAAAAALEARTAELVEESTRHARLVDQIRASVARLPDVEVVGHATRRLPHLVTFSCLYVDGESLVSELDRLGYAVTSGSSCSSSTLQPSHVLEAMGVLTHGNVRVSLGRDTTQADVDGFLGALPGVVTALRARMAGR